MTELGCYGGSAENVTPDCALGEDALAEMNIGGGDRMDVLKQLIQDAQGVLKNMSSTQRVSVVTMLITVMALLAFVAYLGSMGKTSTNVPLPMTFAAADMTDIKGQLEAAGITPIELNLDEKQILVPMEMRSKAILFLAKNKILPSDSASGFEAMLKQVAFSDTPEVTHEKMTVALQNEIEWMVESLDVVKEARVIYSKSDKPSLFRPNYRQRATVQVTTSLGKELDQPTAETIIRLVAYACAGLEEKDVIVTDQKAQHFRISDTDALNNIAKSKIDQQEQMNNRTRDKIEELLRVAVPDCEAFVFVDAKWDMTRKTISEHEVIEGPALRKIKQSTSDKTRSGPAAETGVRPNVGRASLISGGSVESRDYNSKYSDDNYQNGHRDTQTVISPEVKSMTISAVVHLPYEYHMENNEWVYEKDAAGNPVVEKATGKPIRQKFARSLLNDEEKAALERNIRKAAGMLSGQENMEVELMQVAWTPPLEPAPPAPTTYDYIFDFMKSNVVPLVLLGVLFAVVYFIYMQARRSIPSDDMRIPSDEELGLSGSRQLSAEEAANAEFQDLREKIGEVVAESPEKAAGLLRRWMQAREGY